MKHKQNSAHDVTIDTAVWCTRGSILASLWRLSALAGGILLVLYCVAKIHNIESVVHVTEILEVSNALTLSSRCVSINLTHAKCLPNVFLIGASKAGSTSLFHTLLQHPAVRTVERKRRTAGSAQDKKHYEIHRFDRPTYAYSLPRLELMSEYASSPAIRIDKQDSTVLLHYTPHYLYAPSVPFELRDMFNNVAAHLKFIVILRDPTKRAESSYWFKNSRLFKSVDKGTLRDFNRSIDAEIRQRKIYDACMSQQRAQGSYGTYELIEYFLNPSTQKSVGNLREKEAAALKICFGAYFRSPSLGLRHVDKGVYIDQLLRWGLNFPRHQFHVMKFEDLTRNEGFAISELLHFLNLGSGAQAHKSINNKSYQQLSSPQLQWKLKVNNSRKVPLSIAIWRKLNIFYAPFNDVLKDVLTGAFKNI